MGYLLQSGLLVDYVQRLWTCADLGQTMDVLERCRLLPVLQEGSKESRTYPPKRNPTCTT
jgi:hypothetical protein